MTNDRDKRPVHGNSALYVKNGPDEDLVLFYKYIRGDNSSGVGASHQTGGTALVAKLIAFH
jgi:hypothetical protein